MMHSVLTDEELDRIAQYTDILTSSGGNLNILDPDQVADLLDLLALRDKGEELAGIIEARKEAK